MADRKNSATLNDESLQNSFQQGFDEGRALGAAQWIYILEATFEGTTLRRTEFSDISQALSEARTFIENGPGTKVTIEVVAVSASSPAAVSAPQPEEDVIDAEVVEED